MASIWCPVSVTSSRAFSHLRCWLPNLLLWRSQVGSCAPLLDDLEFLRDFSIKQHCLSLLFSLSFLYSLLFLWSLVHARLCNPQEIYEPSLQEASITGGCGSLRKLRTIRVHKSTCQDQGWKRTARASVRYPDGGRSKVRLKGKMETDQIKWKRAVKAGHERQMACWGWVLLCFVYGEGRRG